MTEETIHRMHGPVCLHRLPTGWSGNISPCNAHWNQLTNVNSWRQSGRTPG